MFFYSQIPHSDLLFSIVTFLSLYEVITAICALIGYVCDPFDMLKRYSMFREFDVNLIWTPHFSPVLV